MKKFNSINDVRKEIDLIDLKILDLIVDRKKLVVEVVKLKKRDQIIDQERIDKILKSLNKIGEEKGLPPQIVEAIWNAMIESFIKFEEKFFDEIQKKR
mgnify:CR=1 FL=1|tara:strand:+ start:262 stop:555 length:294 start_codon:yes stop_codon:yes gene_type:complete